MSIPSLPRSRVTGPQATSAPAVEAQTKTDASPPTKPVIRDSHVAPGQGAPVKMPVAEAPPSLADLARLRASGQQERVQKNREQLSSLATAAAAQAAAEHTPGSVVTGAHPLLEKFGEGVGLTLGVIVTEALALIPSWNAPLLDPAGKPVQSIEGAVRIGDHDLRKRHEEVVGPKIEAYVKTLPAGVVHDLLEGLAKGASDAPGTSYRLEAKIADMF